MGKSVHKKQARHSTTCDKAGIIKFSTIIYRLYIYIYGAVFQWLSVYASATKKSSNKRRMSTSGIRVPHGERKIPLISQCYSPKGAVLTKKKGVTISTEAHRNCNMSSLI